MYIKHLSVLVGLMCGTRIWNCLYENLTALIIQSLRPITTLLLLELVHSYTQTLPTLQCHSDRL